MANNTINAASATRDYGNRQVKASVFTAYFSERVNAAALYDSIEGTTGTRPEDIVYETLEDVLFLARKNDLAFLAKNKVLVISEHQSTINENMPLRNLIYFCRTVERLVRPRDLYREKRIPLPTPEFYTFYNGEKDFPKEKILRLSDAFIDIRESYMVELTTKVININQNKGHDILKNCLPMAEYSAFMEYIREYRASGLNNAEAITYAIQRCRKANIMTDFLNKYSSEVENMLFTQWNWDDAMEVAKEEFADEVRERVTKEVREELSGKIREEVLDEIRKEVRGEVREEVRGEVREEITEELREKITKEIHEEEQKSTEKERLRAEKAEAELREFKKQYGIQ